VTYLEHPEHLIDPARGPEQTALDDSDLVMLRAALARLPETYQTVLRLRVLEGRSSKDVAALMGRNPDAVRQLQRRALLALQAAVREAAVS
jgi:RNA polymerase sigma-70 factor (ECF subfamily)